MSVRPPVDLESFFVVVVVLLILWSPGLISKVFPFRATPVAYGGCPARCGFGAVLARLGPSQSNAWSELHR